MAGEVEECITLKAENLPTGSISFGRFELESLSWERRSSFSHNRYLEEVEKYSTPGSVTKKKEYFEAHFKKKALLRQVPEADQNDSKPQDVEHIIGDNDSIMEDFIDHGNNELVEFSYEEGYPLATLDEHEVVELQKEKMPTTELSTEFSSFINEEFTEPSNEPLDLDGALPSKFGDNGVQLDNGGLRTIVEDKTLNDNVNGKKQPKDDTVSSKMHKTKKKNESVKMKTLNVSSKSTVEPRIGRSHSRAQPAQHMSKKPSSNSSSITYGTLKKGAKQNMSAEVERQITSKVSSPSTKNGNLKSMANKDIKAKASLETKSEEGVGEKKIEVNPHQVDSRGSDTCRPVNRGKVVPKGDDKHNSIVFNFKSSERAEKRKEYNLKLEKRFHAKVAEMNEIQAQTEVVKVAQIKQLRKSLNFKATPMPSFYHEATSTVPDIKKILIQASATPTKSQNKTLQSPPSNQDCDRNCNRTISPSISSSVDDSSLSAGNRNGNAEGIEAWKSRSGPASAKRENSMAGKGETRKNRMRSGVRSMVGGGLAVHVAS